MSRSTKPQWLAWSRPAFRRGVAGGKPRPLPQRRRLRLEPLEDRRLLSITVNTLVDEADGSIVDGDISLRDAIAAAPSGETIDFAPALTSGGAATINLTLGSLRITNNLTINGPGANMLTIDASGNDATPDLNNGDGSPVLVISNDDFITPDKTVSISGLTLTGGDTYAGGGIHNRENLTLTASIISGNAATDWGGGIYNYRGNLTVIDGTISANVAGYGGGIDSGRFGVAQLTITNTTISDNVANRFSGGGINANRMTVTGSTISGNSAVGQGGGISGSGTVTNSTISDNSTAASGGGIAAFGMTVT